MQCLRGVKRLSSVSGGVKTRDRHKRIWSDEIKKRLKLLHLAEETSLKGMEEKDSRN